MRRTMTTAVALLAALGLVACSGDDNTASDTADAAPLTDSQDAGGGEGQASEEAQREQDEAGDAEAPANAANADIDTQGNSSGDSPAVEAAAAIDPSPRHVIYTVDLGIETDDIERATARTTALTEAAGGFVAHESMHGDDSATLTLRIPTDRQSRFLADLEELGDIRDRSRSAEDVTADVVDVDARVESLRRSIDRVRLLLDDATDLSDIIRIESELARRESELDSLLQRQEQLSSLTSLATVTVTFTLSGAAPDDDDTTLGFLAGLDEGWSAFVSALRYAATGVGAVLPFATIIAVLGVPTWLVVRRRLAHDKALPQLDPLASPDQPQ